MSRGNWCLFLVSDPVCTCRSSKRQRTSYQYFEVLIYYCIITMNLFNKMQQLPGTVFQTIYLVTRICEILSRSEYLYHHQGNAVLPPFSVTLLPAICMEWSGCSFFRFLSLIVFPSFFFCLFARTTTVRFNHFTLLHLHFLVLPAKEKKGQRRKARKSTLCVT